MRMSRFVVAAAGLLLAGVSGAMSAPVKATGWLTWRGPLQTGVSLEKGLPEKWALGGENDLWSYPLGSGGSPVVANGRVYVFGYEGEGKDLQEVLVALNADTGKKIWEHRFNDFLSDIAYDRYAIGSPEVDPETGNVYIITAAGIFACYSPEGKQLWQHSMMEEFGRLTFTNGRNGNPTVDGDLVITRYITGNWGAEGPASDRFYAFDKKSGKLVWSSTPSLQPKDNSFARPYIGWANGKRVLYSGAGDGSVVALNARTGQPLWRYPVSAGGMNASVIQYKDRVIAIHADENIDSSEAGRQVAVRIGAEPKPGEPAPALLDRKSEVWRNDLAAISSSPVLVGNRIYQVNKTGNLCAVDADTGNVLWRHKLAPDQLHASPLYADGKLYVPVQNGQFFILRPTDKGVEELAKVQLEGRCIGAPAVWNGRIYVCSTKKTYAFGSKTGGKTVAPPAEAAAPKPGPTVALQVIPSEVVLHPGQKASFTVRGIDANGFPTQTFDATKAKWAKYIPPTARVKSEMNADFSPQGELVAPADAKPSAGAFEATVDGFKGYIRGRVLTAPPITEDFESFNVSVAHETEMGAKFAYPPLPWIGARLKWEVRELEGNKVLAKTLDNIFFQRATSFIGSSDASNYTVEADVMSDGNRRTMSNVGLVNQRYLIALLGNGQQLEVSSNQDRFQQAVPFTWVPKQWYRLKTRVDVQPDGSGVVRAKVWKKGEAEPVAWTIEAPHANAHKQGAPGIFGFSLQSLFRVYLDNITVTPNAK